MMTAMLDAAIAKLADMPPDEQDRIAEWLLQEFSEEKLWDTRFAESQDALARLAAETREVRAAGRATDLNPDML